MEIPNICPIFRSVHWNIGDALELIAMQIVVPHVEVSDRNSLKLHKTITDEKSTMTYNDLMAFVGMDYAVAA